MTLCVCGHVSADHAQMDEGEYCRFCAGTCLGYNAQPETCSECGAIQWKKKRAPNHFSTCSRYRKAADESTAVLSAGVTPEGLAEETVSEVVNSDPWSGGGIDFGKREVYPPGSRAPVEPQEPQGFYDDPNLPGNER